MIWELVVVSFFNFLRDMLYLRNESGNLIFNGLILR